jgi:hypothetical protein
MGARFDDQGPVGGQTPLTPVERGFDQLRGHQIPVHLRMCFNPLRIEP